MSSTSKMPGLNTTISSPDVTVAPNLTLSGPALLSVKWGFYTLLSKGLNELTKATSDKTLDKYLAVLRESLCIKGTWAQTEEL